MRFVWSQKYLVLDDRHKLIQKITLYPENKSPLSFFVPEKPSSVPLGNSMRHWYLFEAGSVPFCFMSREGSLKSTSNISKVAFVLKDASSCWADVPSRSTRVVLRTDTFSRSLYINKALVNLVVNTSSVLCLFRERTYASTSDTGTSTTETLKEIKNSSRNSGHEDHCYASIFLSFR